MVEYPLRGLENRQQVITIYKAADRPPRWLTEAYEEEMQEEPA